MTDDATTFGTDTSSYQKRGSYSPGAFEIINRQDPDLAGKLQQNKLEGRPAGVYLWVYPNHDLFADTSDMIASVRALLGGDPPLGYWADYEDPGGINEGQLHQFFAALDAAGAKGGYYSGPFGVDHSQFMDRDWWNAAYPTGAAGFPGYGSLWASSRPRPMRIWQFTSSPLDQDVISDDAWYAQRISGGSTPPPVTPTSIIHKGVVMLLVAESDHFFGKKGGFWLCVPGSSCIAVGLNADGSHQPLETVLHNWAQLPTCPVPGAFIDTRIAEILTRFPPKP